MLYDYPYHRVVLDRRPCNATSPGVDALCTSSLCPLYFASAANTGLCTAQCVARCSASASAQWTAVAVWNTGSSGPAAEALAYRLQATCSPTPPCASPIPGRGPCAGNGVCSPASGTCACGVQGSGQVFGGSGCDAQLPLLALGSSKPGQQTVAGQWTHFAVNATPGQPLQVSLTRTGGDPVLFLKSLADGTPGALPTSGDFSSFADVGNYVQAADTAWMVVPNVSAAAAATSGWAAPGVGYYASVYANGASVAVYDLQVNGAACPLGCSGKGACVQGACTCSFGYGGPACGSQLIAFGTGSGSAGATLAAGQWAYFAISVPGRGSSTWDLSSSGSFPTLTVRLQHSGAHPVLLAKVGGVPSLAPAAGFDWPVPGAGYSGTASDVATLQVTSPDQSWDLSVSAGDTVYFGALNFGGRTHSAAACTLTLSVVASNAGDSVLGLNPSFMSVILGIVLSMFLCISLTACRRYGVRWMAARRNRMLWGDLPPGTIIGPDGLVVPQRSRPPPPRGLDAATMASFPESVFEAGQSVKEEEATCSVCLADYEPGDKLCTLPLCGHVFHRACIDEWLCSHQTCPLCRVCLAPQPAQVQQGVSAEAAQEEGQEQQLVAVASPAAGAGAGAGGDGGPAAGGAEVAIEMARVVVSAARPDTEAPGEVPMLAPMRRARRDV